MGTDRIFQGNTRKFHKRLYGKLHKKGLIFCCSVCHGYEGFVSLLNFISCSILRYFLRATTANNILEMKNVPNGIAFVVKLAAGSRVETILKFS